MSERPPAARRGGSQPAYLPHGSDSAAGGQPVAAHHHPAVQYPAGNMGGIRFINKKGLWYLVYPFFALNLVFTPLIAEGLDFCCVVSQQALSGICMFAFSPHQSSIFLQSFILGLLTAAAEHKSSLLQNTAKVLKQITSVKPEKMFMFLFVSVSVNVSPTHSVFIGVVKPAMLVVSSVHFT